MIIHWASLTHSASFLVRLPSVRIQSHCLWAGLTSMWHVWHAHSRWRGTSARGATARRTRGWSWGMRSLIWRCQTGASAHGAVGPPRSGSPCTTSASHRSSGAAPPERLPQQHLPPANVHAGMDSLYDRELRSTTIAGELSHSTDYTCRHARAHWALQLPCCTYYPAAPVGHQVKEQRRPRLSPCKV